MAKERNFNPVQAQRKADKAKAVKKGSSLPLFISTLQFLLCL